MRPRNKNSLCSMKSRRILSNGWKAFNSALRSSKSPSQQDFQAPISQRPVLKCNFVSCADVFVVRRRYFPVIVEILRAYHFGNGTIRNGEFAVIWKHLRVAFCMSVAAVIGCQHHHHASAENTPETS